MANRDELIAQFVEVSGCETGVAEFYLSSSNWSVEDALTNFLGTHNENDNIRGDADEEGASGIYGEEAKKTADKFAKSSSKPKIATLKNMEKDSSSEEEGQAFYAGGSERSGQQVLGPPKRKNFREQLNEMFRMAQEASSDESSPAPSTSTPAINWGQGVRLGMTENDHTVVTKPSECKEASGNKKPVVILKLWRQGFSVDDGELRSYDDPDNKEFLQTVMRGEIPSELLQMGWMVNVDVEDHRHEDFKKTAPVKTFKGSGHTLGSPTPNVEASTSGCSNIEQSAKVSSVSDTTAKEQLNVNNSNPTTTLQIRLADGSRLSAEFNLSHTISDIQQYIRNARPQYANQNFILVSSFPTRELTETSVTIESAGLKNASIMQRLK